MLGLGTVYGDWASLTLSSFVFLALLTLASRYFLGSLKHIPGPFVAKFSSLPLFYQAWHGNRVFWIMEQHRRYGPVIRIAPDKVCVASSDGIKKIYGTKTAKSEAYSTFRYHDVKMCIGLLDVKSAHQRRKGLLPAFSRQNLVEMEPVIRGHLQSFLHWLQVFDRRNVPVDAFKWFRYLTFDVVADISFGQKIGMLDGDDSHFIQQVEYRNKRNSLNGPFPFILPVLRLLRSDTAKHWMEADEEIAKYAIRAKEGWSKSENQDRPRVDILARLEEARTLNPENGLSDKEIIAEMMEILNAGSDTTANTAMFACFELACRPEVQKALQQELHDAFPDPTEPLLLEKLERLPYLDGVCREGLRLHAPIPSYLERVAPPGGLEISGCFIPAGTKVGMQSYTNHRNPTVYPQPEEFIPDRWNGPTPEMKLNFLPFSAGPRACIGLNLANMQLRIHLGHIFRKYSVHCAEDTTRASMRHVEFFAIRPKSGTCNLYFRQIEQQEQKCV
ncbi:hypothetical protein FE257_001328 [Aspergillus nanangensis]|uniref:Cytochrome P450 n=1 Tax=Aspergillus nanangensis TaxID=2582783 RepID=A0AAD4GNZ6_ASPNN|nr:hypothetical protein FE257_001328 [Aspergillus nanangensis]